MKETDIIRSVIPHCGTSQDKVGYGRGQGDERLAYCAKMLIFQDSHLSMCRSKFCILDSGSSCLDAEEVISSPP